MGDSYRDHLSHHKSRGSRDSEERRQTRLEQDSKAKAIREIWRRKQASAAQYKMRV